MKAAEIFRNNMVDVLGKASVSALVEAFNLNQTGESIDYSYVQNVRKGKQNPTIEKSEQIVRVLQLLPGYSWVEYWMFMVPDYFKRFTQNALEQNTFSQQYAEGYVAEVLTTAHRFKIVELEKKQFEQLTELARYIHQQRHGEPGEEVKVVEQFMA